MVIYTVLITKRHTRPYTGLYNKLQNLFLIKGISFEENMELKLTLSFYSSIMFVMIVIETYISEQITEYRFWTMLEISDKFSTKLNSTFRSKFNHGFTNYGCLHCAILKALCYIKVKSPRGKRYSISLWKCSKNVQLEIHQSSLIFSCYLDAPRLTLGYS